jgi:hypothetical protein
MHPQSGSVLEITAHVGVVLMKRRIVVDCCVTCVRMHGVGNAGIGERTRKSFQADNCTHMES